MAELAPIPADLAALGATPDAILAHVDGLARHIETPCGEGSLAWRVWGEGAPMLLLHGGYGSWTHWIRNILPLARNRQVIAVDLPGLGASASAPKPATPESMAAIVVDGLRHVLPQGGTVDVVGFSFGGVLGGHVATQLGDGLRHFVIVGSNGLGLPPSPLPVMRSWRQQPDRAARREVHRETLAAMMFGDAALIDLLALDMQEVNAEAGRVRSPEISGTDTLARVLPGLRGRFTGIWGEHDNIARGALAARRAVLHAADPMAAFHVIPGAGHWVNYEATEAFHTILSGILCRMGREVVAAGA